MIPLSQYSSCMSPSGVEKADCIAREMLWNWWRIDQRHFCGSFALFYQTCFWGKPSAVLWKYLRVPTEKKVHVSGNEASKSQCHHVILKENTPSWRHPSVPVRAVDGYSPWSSTYSVPWDPITKLLSQYYINSWSTKIVRDNKRLLYA